MKPGLLPVSLYAGYSHSFQFLSFSPEIKISMAGYKEPSPPYSLQMITSNLAKESILVYKASCPCGNSQSREADGQA
jgi:hypothetical protein